jgi:outer membrane receptor for ferrienterochelin and colicins
MNHIYRTAAEIIRHNKCFLCLFILSMLISNSNAASAQSDSVDIYNLDLHQLSEVKITSVNKVEQNVMEVPSTIHIITAAEILERGYFTLDEALSDLPGFQFRDIVGFNSYIFQRGIPNQNNLTLVLIDGIQINELNSGGFYGGGQYNLSNVERIEVVFGPASVVYGTNAVSGIINIITKSALEKKVGFQVSKGSFNTSEGDVNFCYTDEKKTFGILVSGTYKKTDKADLKGKEGDYNWTDLMDNFENDYSFDLKFQTGDFILGMNYQNKQASMATFMKSIGTIYRDYGTSWNIQFLNSYAKYKKMISEDLSFSSALYYRNTTVLDNSIYYVVDTTQIGCYRPNDLIGFEAVLNYKASSMFVLTGGIGLEYERLSNGFSYSYSDSPEHKPSIPAAPQKIYNNLVSIFLEPRFNILENLYLSGGLRFDQSSVYDQVFTPRAGISYHFQDYILRFSYAEAFRAPKPWDYTDGLGNASLLPEEMKSLETAVTFSLSKDINIDCIGYKNVLDQAITKEISNEGYKWINSGEVNTDGFEVFLRYFLKSWNLSLNYTFNQSYNEHGAFIPEISKHSGNAGVTYSFNKYFRINIRANYFGERQNPKIIVSTNSTRIDPYLIFHCTLSMINYEGFNIQLSVKNLFDNEYYHTSNRPPDRYRQPQRTIMLSFGYALNK